MGRALVSLSSNDRLFSIYEAPPNRLGYIIELHDIEHELAYLDVIFYKGTLTECVLFIASLI